MNVKLAVVIGFGLMIGALSAAAMLPAARNAFLSGGGPTSSGKALIGGPFQLTDHHGHKVSDKTYRGKYMLVYFGFTYCPDICPASLQVISAALDKLGKKADQLVPLFITVDPERDTAAKMADYVKSFSPRLIGLTGTPQQIQKAAHAYRVYYAKVKNEDYPGDYTVDHSSFLYLMDRKGRFVTHFDHSVGAGKLAEALAKRL